MTGSVVRPSGLATDGVRAASISRAHGRIVDIAEYGSRPAGVRKSMRGPGRLPSRGHHGAHQRSGTRGREGFDLHARCGLAVSRRSSTCRSTVIPATTHAARWQRSCGPRLACHVDADSGGVVPGNAAELEPLAAQGALGFKCFLAPLRCREFEHVTAQDLREALRWSPAELPRCTRGAPEKAPRPGCAAGPSRHRTWLASRPPDSEQRHRPADPLRSRNRRARSHRHLASADALPAILDARAAGVLLHVETCPHYLTFAAEDIASGATAFNVRAADP